MIRFLFIILLFVNLSNCSTKPKSVFICGDRECVNKAEAEQYFEVNLSIEVKLLVDKKTEKTDLIQLNLKKSENKREVTLNKKKKWEKKVKSALEKRGKKNKVWCKKKKKNFWYKKNQKKGNIVNKKKKSSIIKSKNVEDICTILEKCSIEEISKYLIKEGKNRKFPDISLRN